MHLTYPSIKRDTHGNSKGMNSYGRRRCGQTQGEDDVYCFVHKTGDEKGMLKPRWSMKYGKLQLEIDQNPTPRLTRGVCTVQSHIQTLRSRTLVRGGGLQRENLTENTTFGEQNYGTRGLTPSKNTTDAGLGL